MIILQCIAENEKNKNEMKKKPCRSPMLLPKPVLVILIKSLK